MKIYRLADRALVGNLSCEAEGAIGLLDMVESVRAAKRTDGEYVTFLTDGFRCGSRLS